MIRNDLLDVKLFVKLLMEFFVKFTGTRRGTVRVWRNTEAYFVHKRSVSKLEYSKLRQLVPVDLVPRNQAKYIWEQKFTVQGHAQCISFCNPCELLCYTRVSQSGAARTIVIALWK